jgi:NADH-quinone oxidoreductase subunit C
MGETVVGVDLQNSQYELIYFFWSLTKKVMIEVRAKVEGDNPSIDSICDLFPGLDWHEREVHEMFGVNFKGHPNMNLLILPDELEGAYPLRKSFQVSRERVKESGILTPIARPAKPTQASSGAETADGGKTSSTE